MREKKKQKIYIYKYVFTKFQIKYIKPNSKGTNQIFINKNKTLL